jgi:Zn-dependent metalloprotease
VRDRSALAANSRKTDYISQEEVSKAFMKVVSEAYQIQDDEAIALAANMLGFSRLTEDLKSEFMVFLQNWKATKSG